MAQQIQQLRPRGFHKTFQQWLHKAPTGAPYYVGNYATQFGIKYLTTTSSWRNLMRSTGGEPAKLGRRLKDVIKRKNLGGPYIPTPEDEIAELNGMIQRSFKGGKQQNVKRIADPEAGYIARVLRDPNLPGFFPGVTVFHPDPAYLKPIPIAPFGGDPEDIGIGVLWCPGAQHLGDGQTREQAVVEYSFMTGADWILDEEISVAILPGIDVDRAKQLFVDFNSTPVPVGFDELVWKDQANQAFVLTREVIGSGLLPTPTIKDENGKVQPVKIRSRTVFQFVMQTLLGGYGERKGEVYRLYKEDAHGTFEDQKRTLLSVLQKAKATLGARWSEPNLLTVGYGLAALGRVYYNTTHDTPPVPFDEALRRVSKMSWDISDRRWRELGVTAMKRVKRGDPQPNQPEYVSKLSSFDAIHRVVDVITGPQWKDYVR
jgi:hypothetical protein